MAAPANPRLVAVRHRAEALLDLAAGTGLEIGPLAAPIIISPWDVRYVDVYSTDSLRERYGPDPNVVQEDIVDVHFTLSTDDGVRSLAEAAAPGAPYQWAVASHVAEHVPDLIGWLADIATLLADGARFLLMLPDRRYTFDARRPATTVGQLLEAHSRKDTAPSERAVFDHFRYTIPQPLPSDLWAGASVAGTPTINTVAQAAVFRDAALRGEYIDSHVWIFTPEEMIGWLADLGELDMCDFAVEYVMPTAVNELEFTLVLRRLPRDAIRDERMAHRRAAISALEDLSSVLVAPSAQAP